MIRRIIKKLRIERHIMTYGIVYYPATLSNIIQAEWFAFWMRRRALRFVR